MRQCVFVCGCPQQVQRIVETNVHVCGRLYIRHAAQPVHQIERLFAHHMNRRDLEQRKASVDLVRQLKKAGSVEEREDLEFGREKVNALEDLANVLHIVVGDMVHHFIQEFDTMANGGQVVVDCAEVLPLRSHLDG